MAIDGYEEALYSSLLIGYRHLAAQRPLTLRGLSGLLTAISSSALHLEERTRWAGETSVL